MSETNEPQGEGWTAAATVFGPMYVVKMPNGEWQMKSNLSAEGWVCQPIARFDDGSWAFATPHGPVTVARSFETESVLLKMEIKRLTAEMFILKYKTSDLIPFLLPWQVELLAVFVEECGEALQMVGKTLRHGLDSRNPRLIESPSNVEALTMEIGDISATVDLMMKSGLIGGISEWKSRKIERLKKWLHHYKIEDGA